MYLLSKSKLLLLLACSFCMLNDGVFAISYCHPALCDRYNSSRVLEEYHCTCEEVQVIADSLISYQSAVRYRRGFTSCEDSAAAEDKRLPVENIFTQISGHSFRTTPYKFKFGDDTSCTNACSVTYKDEKLEWLKKVIRQGYLQTLLVAGKSVVSCTRKGSIDHCSQGVLQSSYDSHGLAPNVYKVYNHLHLTVYYNTPIASNNSADIHRVIGTVARDPSVCGNSSLRTVFTDDDTSVNVHFSYSVKFVKNDDKWKISSNEEKEKQDMLHYMTFGSFAFMIIVYGTWYMLQKAVCKDRRSRLCGVVDKILTCCRKKLRLDKNRVLHDPVIRRDVFRPPRCAMLLCALLGNGAQTLCTVVIVIVCGCFKLFQSPYNGYIVMCAVYTWVTSSVVAGLIAVRFYGMMYKLKKLDFVKLTLVTGMPCSGMFLTGFTLQNLILHLLERHSSVDFKYLCFLYGLWLAVSLPLTFLGVFIGSWFKNIEVKPIAKARAVRKRTPVSACDVYYNLCIFTSLQCMIVAGETLHIFYAFWKHQAYEYDFYQFLAATMLIYIVMIVLVEQLVIFLRLNDNQEYRWWWQSFKMGTIVGSGLFAHCLILYYWKFHMFGAVNFVAYLNFPILMACILALLSGFIGFLANWVLLMKNYSTEESEPVSTTTYKSKNSEKTPI